jgi:hypothetical protein
MRSGTGIRTAVGAGTSARVESVLPLWMRPSPHGQHRHDSPQCVQLAHSWAVAGKRRHTPDGAHSQRHYPPGRLAHPGDGFGRIVAWMWNHDRDEAMLFLADYFAELRQHQYLASHLTPPVSLDELLSGLRLAWPSTTPEFDYDTFVDQARHEAAGYYGSQI